MSGSASIRGYLLQTIICLLDTLQNDSEWESLSLEPYFDSEKVDIIWYYPNEVVKVTQVKSSQNQINKTSVKKWAKELEDSILATSFELMLIGPCSQGVIDLKMVGKVNIPIPKVLDIDGLIEQAAHRLDSYLENRNLSRVSSVARELIVRALVTKLETYSTTGTAIPREDFNQLLDKWILASSQEVTHNSSYPQLVLKIFRLDHREYRDEIRFLQGVDISPFQFGLILINSAERTVAKDIDITINTYWQDGIMPTYAPIFEGPTNSGWEYYQDRIKYWDAAVLRFRGSERDRCPFGQPLEWNFSLKLQERLIGEFLFCYQISSNLMQKENSGSLKIRMG